MSFRTIQATKAVLAAWTREQELVKEGKGTRDWTPKQQQDILERGRAYEYEDADDEVGKAFEGQHMKSVESYPEYQGNPDNIQFLTRDEHLAAHDGSWLNPTNWYYDPITKEKTRFAEDELIPCKAIELSEPIIKLKWPSEDENNLNQERNKSNSDKSNKPDTNIEDIIAQARKRLAQEQAKYEQVKAEKLLRKLERERTWHGRLWERGKEILKSTFIEGNGLEYLARLGGAYLGSRIGHSNSQGSVSESNSETSDISIDMVSKEKQERDYPSERLSPKEHTVFPQKPRRYGSTYKVQSPYKRGEKRENDNDDSDDE